MPKEDPSKPVTDVAKLRPKVPGTSGTASGYPTPSTSASSTLAGCVSRYGESGAAPAGAMGGGRGVRVPGMAVGTTKGAGNGSDDFTIKEVRRAAVMAMTGGEEDGDDPPDL
ncbi:hypothetical protein Vretimale_18090 [Volvox reticuliferus]|uniref:Uncharacterized protein n=1 Tax=Volvox reticuliferus TaxID=1737510 RepID=A0A8J4G0P0_9CHLO|nr:hypothetical protein Vretifemale_19429 [Volvox reticuliferus]GIM15374.1 hypothetical protein Vretimale_18090 [Volvox reticuliferus]